MKLERNLVLLSGLMLALSYTVTSALAADSTKKVSEPSADDIKHVGKQRGFIFVPRPEKTTETNSSSKGEQRSILVPKSTSASKGMVVVPTPVKTHESNKTTVTTTTAKAKTAAPATTTASVKPHKEVKTANVTSSHKAMQFAANATQTTALKAWLNKDGQSPCYKNGEKMQINVTAEQDCNIMIFGFDGKGTLTQLFPNQYQADNALKAGDTIAVGGDDSPFDYTASIGQGREKSDERIFVYAYPTGKDSPLSIAMTPVDNSPFRSADITMDQYRSLINKSQAFFARDVKVTPKNGVKLAANVETTAPNKVELNFSIERK